MKQSGRCDLIFWTFDSSRPNGHVGAIIENSQGTFQIAHSSKGKGVVLEKMNRYLREKVTKILRLCFGD